MIQKQIRKKVIKKTSVYYFWLASKLAYAVYTRNQVVLPIVWL